MPGEGAALALAGRGVIGAGFALPRDAGRRPPPGELAGAPRGCGIRVGWAQCCRGWFRAPARCRSETGAPGGWRHSRWLGAVLSALVSRSRAMPVGDRRSRRVGHSRWLGAVLSVLVSRSRAMPVGDRRSKEGGAFALAGRGVVGAGFALPRDAGRRPPPGELASAPRGCGIRVGWAQCCRGWFRAPARCRSETGWPALREGAATLAGRSVVGAGFALPCGRVGGRSVVGAGFALPRDAGETSAPGPAE